MLQIQSQYKIQRETAQFCCISLTTGHLQDKHIVIQLLLLHQVKPQTGAKIQTQANLTRKRFNFPKKKKGKEAIGEQRAGERGWSKQQQTGSCKNRKTRQKWGRYKKNPHKKGRLSNALPQKILKKEEPGVTMEDLQQSGNDMWNEPLFTAADPIDPNELQVSEVVLQRCLPGKKEQEETNKTNTQILSFCSDEMKITFHEITSIKSQTA